MQKSFIIVLVTGLVVAMFAVLNAKPVEVNMIFKTFVMSQAIVILVSATLGALAMFLMNIVQVMKLKKQVKQLSKKLVNAGINTDDVTGSKSKNKAKKEQKQPVVEPVEKPMAEQLEKTVTKKTEDNVFNSTNSASGSLTDALNNVKEDEKLQ